MKMGILDKRNEMENKELNKMPYPWGLKHFEDGVANNWTVKEVPLQDDAEQWNVPGKLTPEEKDLIVKNLKFFGTCEALTQDNIAMAVFRHVQDGYVRMALIRQSYEEALHSQTFLTVADSINVDIDDIYEDYKNVPSVKNKIDFITSLIGRVEDEDFDVTTDEGKQDLIRDMVGFYLILEGTFFYTNFSQLLSMRRKNKMKGLAKFIDYIMRDESTHIAIGTDLLNTIIKEYPHLFYDGFKREIGDLFEKAIELEDAFIEDTIADSLLGLRKEEFKEYVRYVADRRLESIGLPIRWGTKNPFPWMSAETDLLTESNFFESKSTSYSTGKIDMNDF